MRSVASRRGGSKRFRICQSSSAATEVPHKRLYCRRCRGTADGRTDDEIRVPIPNSKVNVIPLLLFRGARTDNDDDDGEDRGDRQ